MEWRYINRTIIIAGITVGLFGLFLTWSELRSVRLNQSAELVLRVDEVLETPTNLKLMAIIESSKPILKKDGGEFEEWELDAYLGAYETLYNLYANDLITGDMLYSAFSYSIVQAYQNNEIKEYIGNIQEKNPEVFAGFQDLAKLILKAD